MDLSAELRVRKEVDKAVQAFPELNLEHFISSSHGVGKNRRVVRAAAQGGNDESAWVERGVKVL